MNKLFEGLVIILITVVVLLLLIRSCVQTSETLVLAEEIKTEVVQITVVDPPKGFNLDYVRLSDQKVFDSYSKRCRVFKEGAIEVGKTYEVKIKYITYQYYDKSTETIRVTDGCDLYDQLPLKEVAA